MTDPASGRSDRRDDTIEAGLSAPSQVSAASPQSAQPSARPSAPPEQTVAGLSVGGFVQNKLAVIAVLFGVTGFLGLPLLWMNRRFSEGERWFWAIANTVYTCGLIYGAFRICMWSYRQVFP